MGYSQRRGRVQAGGSGSGSTEGKEQDWTLQSK